MAGISISMKGDFKALDTLEKKSKDVASSIKKAFNSDLGKKAFAGLSIAAAAGAAAVVASVKSALDAGGALSDQMARTGASGENLMILGQAFKNAGMAAEQVPSSINKMQKALAGVNEDGESTAEVIFEIGLAVDDLRSMDPAAALMKIGEAIARVEDPAKRAELAMRLFGRSGGEMLVLMTDPTAFSGARDQLGGLTSTLAENAAAFDAVSDSLGLSQMKMQQAGAAIAVELLPQLEALSKWINETDFSDVGTGIGELINKTLAWADALGFVVDSFLDLTGVKAVLAAGANLSPEEQAAIMADTKAEADLLYQTSRGTAPAATREEQAADAAFAEVDPFAQPVLSAKEQAAADKEWAALLAEEKADRERLYAIELEILEEKKAAEKAKAEAEKAARDRVSDILSQNVEDLQNQQNNLQFQSTIGAVSSMQRMGLGGGVAASGMDYARQSADLQRAMLVQLTAIAAHSAGSLDD